MNHQEANLTARCGLDCSQCFGYTKEISEAAKELRRMLRRERMKVAWEVMPFLGDYTSFKKSLDALAGLRCKGCRLGGGPPWCKIRRCCQKKSFDTCAQCDEFETCDKLKTLEHYHKDEHLQNLRKIKALKINK